jgi:flagellin-like hook-associated protein FlgL
MKQLAVRGSSRELSGSEREVMGQEFARLGGQIDRVSEEITRIVPRGDIPTSYDSVEAFFESVFADETLDGLLDPFSAFSLGVDVDSVHLKTSRSAKAAVGAIDDAVDEMQRIHRDGASTEAHLDAALERLSAFVESIEPDAVVPRDPEAAVEAAELVRLHLMNGRGVSSADQSKNLQLSVTALLQ